MAALRTVGGNGRWPGPESRDIRRRDSGGDTRIGSADVVCGRQRECDAGTGTGVGVGVVKGSYL